MKGKDDCNKFISSRSVKKEGRAAYNKLLLSAREGNIVCLRRGIYATPIQLADTMIDVEAIIPGGVLCLFSAWNIHGLTTALPQAYHVAVKRGRRISLPVYPRIELHHVTDKVFDIGIAKYMVEGYCINVYNEERCVCDAVKFRNKVGMDICQEVVNNYFSRPSRDISRLMDYADRLRVKRILEQYIRMKL